MARTSLSLLVGSLAFISASTAWAQRTLVDSRDQAEGWYLPVHGEVSVEGKPVEEYKVILYKNNESLGEVPIGKKGQFELELDIDQLYTVRVVKEGFQEKIMNIDTTLPEGLTKYPAYDCFINLQATNAQGVDPFYTDFPSAIVRYDAEMKGFYHSEHYLTHIQTRLAGIASATF